MKNSLLYLILVVALALSMGMTAAQAETWPTIVPNGLGNAGPMYDLLNDIVESLNRDRCTMLAAITLDDAAGTGVKTGTIGVLINNVPFYKAGGITTVVGWGNVVGSTTLYSVAAYVLGMTGDGTLSFTRSVVSTGASKALAQAGVILPTLTAGVVPVAAVVVTVDPHASAATWTAGTSLTTTSEIMALVGSYDGGDNIPSFTPVRDSGY